MKELFPDAHDYTEIFSGIAIPRHSAAEIAAEYDVKEMLKDQKEK